MRGLTGVKILAVAACALALSACGSGSTASPPAATEDAAADATTPAIDGAPADAGAEAKTPADSATDATDAGCALHLTDAPGGSADAGWLEITPLDAGTAAVVAEKVTYTSSGLQVHAVVCHPADGQRHPTILFNHGGFTGLNASADGGPPGAATDISFCTGFANNGFAVGASSYRGEDGSQGHVEVCLGEVDDVRALMATLKTMPYVDPTRFFAFGGSHGGCITERLALAEPSLRGAVDVSGPGDWGALDAWLHQNLDAGETEPGCGDGGAATCAVVQQFLVSTVEGAIGGGAAQKPCDYADRSPALALGGLAVPTLMAQGTYDTLVAPSQACQKRQALESGGRPVMAWDLDPGLAVRTPSSLCGGPWQSGPLPDVTSPAAWKAADHYLIVYEQQGHTITGPALSQLLQASVSFLESRL